MGNKHLKSNSPHKLSQRSVAQIERDQLLDFNKDIKLCRNSGPRSQCLIQSVFLKYVKVTDYSKPIEYPNQPVAARVVAWYSCGKGASSCDRLHHITLEYDKKGKHYRPGSYELEGNNKKTVTPAKLKVAELF